MVRPMADKVKKQLYPPPAAAPMGVRETLASSQSGPHRCDMANQQSVAAELSLDLGHGDPRLLQGGAPASNVEAEAGTGDVHGAEEPAVGSEYRNRHARQTVFELVDDHRVALPAHALELALKLARIGDRRRRPALEGPREAPPQSCRVERGENDLAARAGVQRVSPADPVDRL